MNLAMRLSGWVGLMSRYGAKVSQQGVDVTRAADYQKVLDTGWKFVEITHQVSIDVSYSSWATGYNQIILFEHGLGYRPAFEFMPDPGWSMGNPDVYFNNPNTLFDDMKADERYIYIFPIWNASSTTALRVKGVMRVFNVDITAEYKAPSEAVALEPGSDQTKYGAKIIDVNARSARMGDTAIQNYSMNTNAKAISLHSTGVRTANAGNSNKLTITHNIGYPPTYYIATLYALANGTYTHPKAGITMVGRIKNNIGRALATNIDIVFTGAQAALNGDYAFMLLKDPVGFAG